MSREQQFPIKELGVAIREARVQAGLSPGALANRAGVSTRTIERWELGDTPKARDRLNLVAEHLGCGEQDLVDRAYELAGRARPTSQPTGEERLGELIAELRDNQTDMIGRLAHLEELLEAERKSESPPENSDGSNRNS